MTILVRSGAALHSVLLQDLQKHAVWPLTNHNVSKLRGSTGVPQSHPKRLPGLAVSSPTHASQSCGVSPSGPRCLRAASHVGNSTRFAPVWNPCCSGCAPGERPCSRVPSAVKASCLESVPRAPDHQYRARRPFCLPQHSGG